MAALKDTASGDSPVAALVRTVLLEDKGGATRSAVIEGYAFKWCFANEFDLVIVIVYQKLLQCLYADELLELLKQALLKHVASFYPKRGAPLDASRFPLSFDEAFSKCQRKAMARLQETKTAAAKIASGGGGARSPQKSGAGAARGPSGGGDGDEGGGEDDAEEADGEGGEGGDVGEGASGAPGDAMMSARARLKLRAKGKDGPGKGKDKGGGAASATSGGGGGGGGGGSKKEATVWRDAASSKKLSKSAADSLDFSKRGKEGKEGELDDDAAQLKEYVRGIIYYTRNLPWQRLQPINAAMKTRAMREFSFILLERCITIAWRLQFVRARACARDCAMGPTSGVQCLAVAASLLAVSGTKISTCLSRGRWLSGPSPRTTAPASTTTATTTTAPGPRRRVGRRTRAGSGPPRWGAFWRRSRGTRCGVVAAAKGSCSRDNSAHTRAFQYLWTLLRSSVIVDGSSFETHLVCPC